MPWSNHPTYFQRARRLLSCCLLNQMIPNRPANPNRQLNLKEKTYILQNELDCIIQNDISEEKKKKKKSGGILDKMKKHCKKDDGAAAAAA